MPPPTRQLPKHPRLPDFDRADNFQQLKDELQRWFENEFLQIYRDLYGGITKVIQVEKVTVTETIVINELGDLTWGDENTDGSYRFKKVGNDFQLQRRIAGTWTYVGGWEAS